MAKKRPVLRNLLIVALAILVLITVAAVSYKLGVRHASNFTPAVARLEGGSGEFGGLGGPSFGAYSGGDEDGGRAFFFGRGARHFERTYLMRFPVARFLPLLIGATLFGMLALGVVAFFRTGGWRPVAASAAQTSRKKRS